MHDGAFRVPDRRGKGGGGSNRYAGGLGRDARRLFRRAGQASTPNEQERLLEEVNLLLDERDQLQAQVEDEQQAFMRDFCLGVRAHVNFLEAMKEKP